MEEEKTLEQLREMVGGREMTTDEKVNVSRAKAVLIANNIPVISPSSPSSKETEEE